VNLLIATIQANLIWEDRLSNLAFFEKAFEEVDKNTTLVILPEMFTTGFSMNPKKN
jgi:predicted amidohydrolase